jgi:predicted nucleic acid-binding protein
VLQAVIDGAAVVVPAIWKLEVVNTLVVAERRKKVAPEKGAAFVRDLDGLDRVFSTVLTQARLYQRSAYDASYLELAQRRGLPLATRDQPLGKAAQELGISLFRP